MDVLVTGSHGFIAGALIPRLRADGHRVLRLVRGEPEGADDVRWDPDAGTIDADRLDGIDAVVHLAGAGIGDKKWTPERKQLVLDEPHAGHRAARPHARRPPEPASRARVGLGDRVLRQPRRRAAHRGRRRPATTSPPRSCAPGRPPPRRPTRPGSGWCGSAAGIVLAAHGGVLHRLLLPFKLGVGGRLGLRRAVHELDRPRRRSRGDPSRAHPRRRRDGPVNLTAPNPVTNARVRACDWAPRCTVPPWCRRRCSRSRWSTGASSCRRCSSTASVCRRRSSSRAASSSRIPTSTDALRSAVLRAPAVAVSPRAVVRTRRRRRRGLRRLCHVSVSRVLRALSCDRGWGDRGDSNPRPPGPQPGALTN